MCFIYGTTHQRWKWVSGSWVTAIDPLTHDHKITAQLLATFLFVVDINKLLTHSISPNIIAGDLILTYDFFLLWRPRGLSSTTMPRPLVPCVEIMTMGHGSRKMTHFHLCHAARVDVGRLLDNNDSDHTHDFFFNWLISFAFSQSRRKNPPYPRPGGGSRCSGASCYVWKKIFCSFFNVF